MNSGVLPRRPVQLFGAALLAALAPSAGRVAEFLAAHADAHDRAGSYVPDNTAAVWRAGLGSARAEPSSVACRLSPSRRPRSGQR
jgi:hypothetical protein